MEGIKKNSVFLLSFGNVSQLPTLMVYRSGLRPTR